MFSHFTILSQILQLFVIKTRIVKKSAETDVYSHGLKDIVIVSSQYNLFIQPEFRGCELLINHVLINVVETILLLVHSSRNCCGRTVQIVLDKGTHSFNIKVLFFTDCTDISKLGPNFYSSREKYLLTIFPDESDWTRNGNTDMSKASNSCPASSGFSVKISSIFTKNTDVFFRDFRLCAGSFLSFA